MLISVATGLSGFKLMVIYNMYCILQIIFARIAKVQ